MRIRTVIILGLLTAIIVFLATGQEQKIEDGRQAFRAKVAQIIDRHAKVAADELLAAVEKCQCVDPKEVKRVQDLYEGLVNGRLTGGYDIVSAQLEMRYQLKQAGGYANFLMRLDDFDKIVAELRALQIWDPKKEYNAVARIKSFRTKAPDLKRLFPIPTQTVAP